jgi:hypothetical protein
LKFTETDKRGIRIITKACLEKMVKKQSMQASEPTPVHIVKGQMNINPYASAVGSLMSAQL